MKGELALGEIVRTDLHRPPGAVKMTPPAVLGNGENSVETLTTQFDARLELSGHSRSRTFIGLDRQVARRPAVKKMTIFLHAPDLLHPAG